MIALVILYVVYVVVFAFIEGMDVSILELLNLKLLSDKDSAANSTPGFPFNYSLIIFIVETELTIRWNHIEGVDSVSRTGQIIPLVIAGAGFVRVAWKYIVYSLKENTSTSSISIFPRNYMKLTGQM